MKTLFCVVVVLTISSSTLISQIKYQKNKSDEPVYIRTDNFRSNQFSDGDEYGIFRYNRVLQLEGDSLGHVYIFSGPAFEQSFDGCFESWIFPLSQVGTCQLIGKASGPNVQFVWGLSGNLQYFRIGTTSVINTGGIAIPINKWTHIAVTWTGGNPYTIKFYVDGSLSGAPVALNNPWVSNSEPFTVGGNSSHINSDYYTGRMDEIRFWDNERSEEQIRNNRFIGLCDVPGSNNNNAVTSSTAYTGLIASWTFNGYGGEEYINGLTGYVFNPASPLDAMFNSPIPYNFSLKIPGTGGFSTVNVPHNINLNVQFNGTLETWIFTSDNNQTRYLVSKGNTADVSFAFGLSANGKLFARFGSEVSVNNDGITIPVNEWTHVAFVWNRTGSIYNISFYINDKLSGSVSNNSGVFSLNSDPMTIGGSKAFPAQGWSGYVDELRIWSTSRTDVQLRNYMFASCKVMQALFGLVGAWNFDGNLLNSSAVSGLDGSFNTGGVNNCRFSGFLNEELPISFGPILITHTTAINRNENSNPFPVSFSMSAPFKPIFDNQFTIDTLNVSGTSLVTLVELFLSIRHSRVSDLSITLTSPNGRVRNIISGNGGIGSNILSFFMDFEHNINDPFYPPPWSYLGGTIEQMGTFDNSVIQGKWILRVRDNTAGNTGKLLGWGLRFNHSIGIKEINSEVPTEFKMFQNFPNPFNPQTKIRFSIPSVGTQYIEPVQLGIYDILGRKVATLVSEKLQPGTYEVEWEASNFPSGIYFYKLIAGDYKETKKMVLLK